MTPLPCPCCHSPAFTYPHHSNKTLREKLFFVGCGSKRCGIRTQYRRSSDRAIEDWNGKRVPDGSADSPGADRSSPYPDRRSAMDDLLAYRKLTVRECSICDHPIGYILHPTYMVIGFDSSCGCCPPSEPRFASHQEWADFVKRYEGTPT